MDTNGKVSSTSVYEGTHVNSCYVVWFVFQDHMDHCVMCVGGFRYSLYSGNSILL